MMTPARLFDLSGKTAVVIGGTGELCGAMAEALAGAGAYVILAGRSEEKAAVRLGVIREAGGAGEFLPVEASERGSLEGLLAGALASAVAAAVQAVSPGLWALAGTAVMPVVVVTPVMAAMALMAPLP